MNSSAHASSQARCSSSSDAFASPQRRFSLIVPENSTFFCSTTATWLRSVSRSYCRTSTPPTRTLPSVTSYSRQMSCTRLVLEDPVPPMMPTVWPDLTWKSTSESALRFAAAEYLKLTWSKSTSPFFTS